METAEAHRGLLKLRYPMEHGIVTNWEDMETLWNHTYSELKVKAPEQHPVLLTEPPLNPRKNREKAAEIFFESINAPSLFVCMQAVLSLYASGRTTGVVLDSGDGVTHVVPIYEGFSIPQGIMRNDLAGRDVTEYLQLLLRRSGHNFHTSAEKEIVKNIKETACYVFDSPFDPKKEEILFEAENRAKHSHQPYKLPDGNTIEIGAERFLAPEILFRPELVGEEYVGVHQLLTNAILKTDLDLRRTLYSKIVLSGGSTLFKGFGERLLNEVKQLAPRDIKIKISAPQERKYSTWIGGSILASLPTFKNMLITREEYEEEGVSIIHKKTF